MKIVSLFIFILILFNSLLGMTQQEKNNKLLILVSKRGESALKEIQELIAQGADINTTNNKGMSPVMIALSDGYMQRAEWFINKKANVNIQNNQGQTPLMLAAQRGFVDTSKLLIAHGASIYIKDNEGRTALMHAIASGDNLPIVEFFSTQPGSDINAADNKGITPLMMAVSLNPVKNLGTGSKIIDFLLNTGAHINVQDNNGMTPLMIAASKDYGIIIPQLIAKGADATLKNKEDKTASDLASDPAIKASLLQTAAQQSKNKLFENNLTHLVNTLENLQSQLTK